MTDEEFAKTLTFKVGEKVKIETYEKDIEVVIEEIDISAHRPSRLQNPYKIRYPWGETQWTDLKQKIV